MRQTTRRRFLAEAAGSGAGVVACAGMGPELFAGVGTVLAAEAEPSMRFPEGAGERIAIASYPFRDFIAARGDKADSGKMELREFAQHVAAKFKITRIEPWSEHFRSLDKDYLMELAAATGQAYVSIVNI